MRKYYISFVVLTVIVIAALIKGFTVSGSPFTQRGLNLDAKRISQISSIHYAVDSYYQQYGTLPKTLDDLSTSSSTNDPETQKPFDYKVKNQTSYSVCTTFSTDTKDPKSPYRSGYSYTSVGSTKVYHSKGYDCIELATTQRYVPSVPTVVKEKPTNTLTFYGTVDSIAKSDTQPRMVVKDNNNDKLIRIFNIEGAEILNTSGEKVNYELFKQGDKVIVDYAQAGNYTTYQATRIQNLSR